jgi:hypothetical protein
MLGYLASAHPRSAEEITDEMLAICDDRDRWMAKKKAEYYNGKVNEIYWRGPGLRGRRRRGYVLRKTALCGVKRRKVPSFTDRPFSGRNNGGTIGTAAPAAERTTGKEGQPPCRRMRERDHLMMSIC